MPAGIFIVSAISQLCPRSKVCKQLGVRERTYHRWRHRYWGVSEAEAERLREHLDGLDVYRAFAPCMCSAGGVRPYTFLLNL